MLAADNPMGRPLGVLLILQAVVFGLAIPGMIVVNHVPGVVAGVAAGGAALLALAAAGTLRWGIGYPLGWLAQAAGLGLTLLNQWMLVLGAIFAGLWVLNFVLGKRLEAGR